MKLFKKKQSIIPRRRLSSEVVESRSIANIFKRNRTFTSKTSNYLDDVNNKNINGSSRSQTHHLTIKRRKVFSVLLTVLLASLIIWLLISNFTAKVAINLSNTQIVKQIDSSIYEKAIQEYLDINPTNRFSFLLDQSALTTFVISKLPEVAEVKQQTMVSIGETGFLIIMRTPIAGWNINDKQYFVDSKGVSFEKNYFSEPDVQIIDNSGVLLQSGAAVVSKRFLSFVGRIVSESKNIGYTVTQAILPLNTTRELNVRIKEGDYLVKLSIDRSVGEQVEDMSKALGYFNSHGYKPEYIDVRVSGKAFYR